MGFMEQSTGLEQIEVRLLLEGLYLYYGYDFRNYALSSITRRIKNRVRVEGIGTISALTDRILHDRGMMERLLGDFSIKVTEMFRDPSFFSSFRRRVLPELKEYTAIRIWHAGCSTGEEVYSMAILLMEAGLYDRTTIYATDMNPANLAQARLGRFPLKQMQLYTRNYLQSGGERAFSEYYYVYGNEVQFGSELSRNIVFSQHNLVTDHSFNEFHIIICRNVLIYFNDSLQRRAFQLFYESLVPGGILGLGSKEGIPSKLDSGGFVEVEREERLYRKSGKKSEI